MNVEDLSKEPKASDVIKHLQAMIEKYGDLSVIADDADTRWRLSIGIAFREGGGCELPGRFEIKTDYHSDPDGYIERDSGS